MVMGNLGRDPEMRYTPGGKPVTSFSVAVSRRHTKPEGRRAEVTDWFNVVAWGRLAEICSQYLTKGSMVYVEGRLEARENGMAITDKNTIAAKLSPTTSISSTKDARATKLAPMDSALGDIDHEPAL